MKLRKQMQIELKRLQKQLGITFVYVTHDQEEGLTMSDRIAIINQGVLEQIDTPKNIYERPKTKFVAGFIGESNIFDAMVERIEKDCRMVTESGYFRTDSSDFTIGEALAVSVRPEDMKFSLKPVEGFSIKGVVKDQIYVGNLVKMIVQLGNGEEVKINRFNQEELADVGALVYLHWDSDKGVLMKTKNPLKGAIDLSELGGAAGEKE